MPFRLMNVAAIFQQLMESFLVDFPLNYCIIYIDDIIIYSKIPSEHIKKLQKVFKNLANAGLKLKPSKFDFFHTRLAYLSHIVSVDSIETDPKKITAIKNWPTPTTSTEV